jgi:hypothetical protein
VCRVDQLQQNTNTLNLTRQLNKIKLENIYRILASNSAFYLFGGTVLVGMFVKFTVSEIHYFIGLNSVS